MKLKSLSINEKSTESQHGHFEDTSLRDKHSRQLRSGAQSKAAENGQRQKEQQQKEAAPATRLSQPEEKKQKGMQSRTSQLCGWGDILQYPKAVPCKKKRAGTSDFPAHISSSQMIDYLRQKEEKKQAEEEAKRKRKEDRELKKQQREAEKERKAKGRRANVRQEERLPLQEASLMTHLKMRSYARLAPVARITEMGGYAAMFAIVGSTKTAQTYQVMSTMIYRI